MDQQGLCSIAYRHVLTLGVHGNLDGHIQIRVSIRVNVTYSVSMAQHGNVGIIHDMTDQIDA